MFQRRSGVVSLPTPNVAGMGRVGISMHMRLRKTSPASCKQKGSLERLSLTCTGCAFRLIIACPQRVSKLGLFLLVEVCFLHCNFTGQND